MRRPKTFRSQNSRELYLNDESEIEIMSRNRESTLLPIFAPIPSNYLVS
jgi:hypothetical protein